MDDLDRLALLRLEIDTLWEVDDGGRLLRSPSPHDPMAPRVAVAGSPAGSVWAFAAELAMELTSRIEELLGAGERAAVHELGWSPEAASEIRGVLRAAGLEVQVVSGPSYLVPEPVEPPGDLRIWSSRDHDLEDLRGRIDEQERRSLRAPWAVALVDDEVASICETARSTPRAVEAGVRTFEAHRRQGLAAGVTAAWTALVRDRVAFYSTSDDNVASQGVARSLGLVPLGSWWQVLLD